MSHPHAPPPPFNPFPPFPSYYPFAPFPAGPFSAPASAAPTIDPAGVARAWQDEFERFGRRLASLPKVLETARKTRKGCTPHDVVMSEPPVRLIRYTGQAARRHATPVLFVFALVNRPYVLDLLPHKSVVRRFLDAGFDTCLIDWGTPSPSDATKTIHDYVEGHLHRAVQRLLDDTGADRVNLVGYCMGGTLSAMYTALHPDLVKNLVLMAAPIDWSSRDSLLLTWTDPRYFDVDAVVDAFGLIPPAFLGTSFALLKPVANFFQKWAGFYEKMDDEKFLEEFFAMEVWSNDNIPIAGEVYRDFVKFGFQQNLLVQGRFPVGPRRVNLADISCPVLTLTADADHLVLPCQSTPIRRCIRSTDYAEMSVKAGHIGLSVGSRAHKELWPRVTEWLAERSDHVSVVE